MLSIKVYPNLYLIETSEDVLQAVIEEEVFCGMLIVDYKKGQAEFHCEKYQLYFECFGIQVQEKEEQLILFAGERDYIFSSHKPEYACDVIENEEKIWKNRIK